MQGSSGAGVQFDMSENSSISSGLRFAALTLPMAALSASQHHAAGWCGTWRTVSVDLARCGATRPHLWTWFFEPFPQISALALARSVDIPLLP